MIIVVCTDDPSLVGVAINSSNANPEVFGAVYQAFGAQIPQLGPEENLFVIAHGAFHGDEGGPVIGDQADAFYVTPSVLFATALGLFPEGWSGSVYIDACYSATEDTDLLSFAQLYQLPMTEVYAQVKVSGIGGESSGLIPLPKDPKWTTFPK